MGNVQFIRGTPRKSTLARAVEAAQMGVQGYQSGQDRRMKQEEGSLARMKTMAELNAMDMQAPEGFVNVAGQIKEDPGYFNPQKEQLKAQLKAEEEARAFGRIKELTGGGNDNSQIDQEIARIEQELASLGGASSGEDLSSMSEDQLRKLAYGGV